MATTPTDFSPLPARSAELRRALEELQTVYAITIDKAQSDLGRILITSAQRQADLVLKNLDLFDKDGTHLFTTSRNLGLLEDLADQIARLNLPSLNSARAHWEDAALELRGAILQAAPAMGLSTVRDDFSRVSLEVIHAASAHSFSELSDFGQLPASVVIGLKTGVADGMGRGLSIREISRQLEGTGIPPLEAIPGFRRAFSVQERAESIGRTEIVRLQTQLQEAWAQQAQLDYGRSYLNWFLKDHADECLWAEALGWAPVAEFQAGPGLPPRHPQCGCNWQRGLEAWVEPGAREEMARQFADRIAREGIKLSKTLVEKLPAHLLDELGKQGLLPKTVPAAPAPQPPPPPPPSFPALVHQQIGTGISTVEQTRAVGRLVQGEWEGRAKTRRSEASRALVEAAEERDRLVERYDAALAEYGRISGEAARALAAGDEERYRQIHADARKTFAEVEALDEQVRVLRPKIRELDEKVVSARRDALKETLSELRPLGQAEQRWAKGSRKSVKDAVAEVSAYLPTAWLEVSRSFGELDGKESRRGYYRHATTKPSTLAVSDRGGFSGGRVAVAIHELGHRFEHVIPKILELERLFYEERTAGEKLEPMGPGYRRDERTRKDRFADRYMGKDYSGTAYELLSMALESLVYSTDDLEQKDPDMLHWALGLLAGV